MDIKDISNGVREILEVHNYATNLREKKKAIEVLGEDKKFHKCLVLEQNYIISETPSGLIIANGMPKLSDYLIPMPWNSHTILLLLPETYNSSNKIEIGDFIQKQMPIFFSKKRDAEKRLNLERSQILDYCKNNNVQIYDPGENFVDPRSN